MKTLSRSLLGLGLLLALVGTTVVTASVTTAAPAGPTAQATLKNNWVVMPWQTTSSLPHYTVTVTGANFVPAARVDMAVIDTRTLKVVHRGSAYSGSKYLGLGLGYDVPNPASGKFEYQESFNTNSTALITDAHLWCRSTNHLDIHNVTMQ